MISSEMNHFALQRLFPSTGQGVNRELHSATTVARQTEDAFNEGLSASEGIWQYYAWDDARILNDMFC